MIEQLAIAIIIAVIVALVVLFVGRAIVSSGSSVPILATVGGFMVEFCWLIGLVAGALYFITGGHLLSLGAK